ncbi:hypothetical protein RND71_044173 [Anisodus tanguticus]|uniref:Uncharacterized protein n=1 Tax=Anisodus tanguticus TaxID=243964 RepID=A0AAE1UM47_9SOLA|nr:hypothetical protein RND71_044173 [Anisodus tanguticus]
MEIDVRKELEQRSNLRDFTKTSINDNVIISSIVNNLSLDDGFCRHRLIVSELLAVQTFTNLINTNHKVKDCFYKSELFDHEIYINELSDVICIALTELPNTLRLLEVVEALLYVKTGPREGGGNNYYGNDIVNVLEPIRNSKERDAFILMDLIEPQKFENYVISSTKNINSLTKDKLIGELGVFGVILADQKTVFHNYEAGCLLRSKNPEVNEGGIVSGQGVLDTIGSYDQPQWEKSVEEKVLNGIHLNETKKVTKLKTDALGFSSNLSFFQFFQLQDNSGQYKSSVFTIANNTSNELSANNFFNNSNQLNGFNNCTRFIIQKS